MSRLTFQANFFKVAQGVKVKEVVAAKAVVVTKVNVVTIIEAKVEIAACQIIKMSYIFVAKR